MKLTRGLVVGSMLGMAAAMMVNNQSKGNNTSYSSDMNSQNRVNNNSYSSSKNNQSSRNNNSYSSDINNQSSRSNASNTKGSNLIVKDDSDSDLIITDILK